LISIRFYTVLSGRQINSVYTGGIPKLLKALQGANRLDVEILMMQGLLNALVALVGAEECC
jgi:hypothetical protein